MLETVLGALGSSRQSWSLVMRHGDLGASDTARLRDEVMDIKGTLENRKYRILAISKSLRACRPRTQAPRRDESCYGYVSIVHTNFGAVSTTRTNSYFFSAATARSVISRPLQINSHLSSSTSSSCPLVPIAGLALSLGLKCPVPGVVKQHSL